MPIYEYKCTGCAKKFDAFLKLADYAQIQTCPDCCHWGDKVLSAPAVFGDLPGYESPATGQWVEGRKARNEDMKRSGCVEYEKGMREQNARKREEHQKADEKKLEEVVGQVYKEISN